MTLQRFAIPTDLHMTAYTRSKMSLGSESLDEALWALGGPGTVVPFEFAYTNADPHTAANPHWTGTRFGRLAIPIVDAGINETTKSTSK